MTTAPARPTRASGTRLARETARLLAGPLEKLNFGCGTHPLAGWTNIDNGDGVWYEAPSADAVIKLDIFEALDALPDGCAACVYSEHLFEHFSLEDGHRLIREWFRILKPGGVLRIVCPDLEAEAQLFLRQITPAADDTIDRHRRRWLGDRYRFQPGERLTRAMVLNYGMWLDGHKFVYDEETLRQSLNLAGFEHVTRETFGHSSHAALNAVDTHDGGETGRGWIPSIALVVEATRPGAGCPGVLCTASPAKVVEPAAPASPAGPSAEALKQRVIELTAETCAANGYRRIALYGAGRHTAPITHEPWAARGIAVVAILDDRPTAGDLNGVPVMTPAQLSEHVDAVVISSDAYEEAIAQNAETQFGPKGLPIVRIYGNPARS